VRPQATIHNAMTQASTKELMRFGVLLIKLDQGSRDRFCVELHTVAIQMLVLEIVEDLSFRHTGKHSGQWYSCKHYTIAKEFRHQLPVGNDARTALGRRRHMQNHQQSAVLACQVNGLSQEMELVRVERRAIELKQVAILR